MKRVIQHPPAPAKGRSYWRSVGEKLDTPEFRAQLEREFPQGIAELEAGVSRRDFVKFLSASMALAGVGLTGCRRPEAYLVPFTTSPEWLIPGRHLHYSTAMPRRGGGVPLRATTFEGRPTKLEGNPLHRDSLGKSDSYAQAAVLDLYDADRSRKFVKAGKPLAAEAFYAEIEAIAKNFGDGSSVAVLADGCDTPTRERLRAELLKKHPKLAWVSYEPLAADAVAAATSVFFGEDVRLLPRMSKAQVILSVDSDFLAPHEGGLRTIREFAAGRKVRKAGDKMNRLYAVEHRFTITGGSADHRLRLPAAQMGAFLCALAGALDKLGVGGGLADLANASGCGAECGASAAEWIEPLAKDLADNKGRALVMLSERQPAQVQLLALAINQALGAMGQTLRILPNPVRKADTIQILAHKIKQGQVKTLVVMGGNPVYNAPADLELGKLLKTVPTVVHLGSHIDETAATALLHAPRAHFLEAWGDVWSSDGSYLTAQPMILPLWEALSDIQLLALFLGVRPTDGPELVQATFAAAASKSPGSLDFDAAWKKALHDGFLASGTPASETKNGSLAAAKAYLAANRLDAPRVTADRIEVVFDADYSVEDGRYTNNGWMQEFPDPVTKLTWENAALMSAVTARRIGVKNAIVDGIMVVDKVRITLGMGTVEAPALIVPGHSDYSISLPLGYGREKVGRVGKGVGFNAYRLRATGLEYFAVGAQVSIASSGYKLAITQEHHAMEGRAVVREAPLEYFNQDPEFANKVGIDSHAPPNKSFYENPPLTAPHQWGMSIDLTSCTGCNACVISCQAENNIPIVGKDQVAKGREMHWIRVDRYFSGENIEDPEMLMQPLTCMQCENAPCETVCPVNATIHNEEGLNVMTYNRCVGTRYCANNCPYKVRRFNYFNYNERPLDKLYWGPFAAKDMPETVKMQKNPNVTVRMRGVMEKCTFCVQRLEAAKIDHKAKNAFSPDVVIETDSVMTACQQSCPSDAIVFGNISDKASKVAVAKAAPHDYGLLEYLNVKPRVSYLARIRNINPEMPRAEELAMSTLDVMNESHGGGHGAEENVKDAGEDTVRETYKTESNH